MFGLRRIIAFGTPLLMFCIGVVEVFRIVAPPAWRAQVGAALPEIPEISVLCFWLLVVLLPWSMLLLKVIHSSGSKLLELGTESGSKLNVREKAVNRYVADCLESMSFVRDVRVRTKNNRGALEVSIRVWVAATDKVDALQQRIVQTVVEDLKRGFGIAEVLEPKIIIESVKTARRKNNGGFRKMKTEKSPKEEPCLSEEMPAISAPEMMTEKEVLDFTPFDPARSDTPEDDKPSYAPSGDAARVDSPFAPEESKKQDGGSEDEKTDEDEK